MSTCKVLIIITSKMSVDCCFVRETRYKNSSYATRWLYMYNVDFFYWQLRDGLLSLSNMMAWRELTKSYLVVIRNDSKRIVLWKEVGRIEQDMVKTRKVGETIKCTQNYKLQLLKREIRNPNRERDKDWGRERCQHKYDCEFECEWVSHFEWMV